MVARRTSSQKPGDEFIANFRQTFPEVAVATSSAGSGSGNTSLGDAIAGGPHPDRYVDLLIHSPAFVAGSKFKRLRASMTLENEALTEQLLVASKLGKEIC